MGRNLSIKIPQQPNLLLSGEYKINESTEQPTEINFHPVDETTINSALGKMQNLSDLDLTALRVTSLKLHFL